MVGFIAFGFNPVKTLLVDLSILHTELTMLKREGLIRPITNTMVS